MPPSAAMICMWGISDAEFEETVGEKMKCLANNIFFWHCAGIKDEQVFSLLISSLSKRVNLPSEAEVHVLAGVNQKMRARSWKSGRNHF